MSFFDRHGIHDPRSETLARVSEMQELGTFENTRLVGPLFGTASVTDTNFWTLTTTAAATASAVNTNNVVVLNPGEQSASKAQVVSVRKARFMFANPNLWRGLIKYTADDGGSTRLFGAVDLTNWNWYTSGLNTLLEFNGGFYFEINGITGNLTINYRNMRTWYQLGDPTGAFPTSVGPLNGEVTSYTVDGNYHAYEIQYFMAKAHFYVDGVLVGTLKPTTTPFNVLQLYAGAVTYNVSGGFYAPGHLGPLYVAAMSILRLGKEHSVPTWKYITNSVPTATLKRGAGELHTVINNDNVGSIIFYDATSAVATATIASIDLTKVLGELNFDANFETGLYYALTGAGKVTVTFE